MCSLYYSYTSYELPFAYLHEPLSPCWALWSLTLGTMSTEMANDDKLWNCYGTDSLVLQEFPINIQYVTSQPQLVLMPHPPSCVWGGWCQSQLSEQRLFAAAFQNLFCVKAGKCQGPSWWFRSDQIWNVSGCCMCTDVRGAWSELKKAEWSWWLFRKAVFLIKKDSIDQCS